MGGTRKIPHSCHRKKAWRFFLICIVFQMSVNFPFCSSCQLWCTDVFILAIVYEFYFRLRAETRRSICEFLLLRLRVLLCWGIRLCPPLDLGFSVVLGLSTFAVSVTPPVLCAWRSTCSRYDKGWFRGKEVVVLGSTYGQPLRVPGDPEVDHFSANQGQTLVLKWVGIVRFSADWFGGHNIC